MQPGKGGTVIILHRPVGNRRSPKVCGVMPSRNHAKSLVDQLRRAESALLDLFYEATDDGIEALEAVLDACRQSVIRRGELADGGHAGAGPGARKRGRNRRRGPGPRTPGGPQAPADGAEDTSAA